MKLMQNKYYIYDIYIPSIIKYYPGLLSVVINTITKSNLGSKGLISS